MLSLADKVPHYTKNANTFFTCSLEKIRHFNVKKNKYINIVNLIKACDQRAQHPAVVVQPPGAEVPPPVAEVEPPVAEIQNVRHPVQNKNKHKKCVVDNCPNPNNVSYP